MGALVIASKFKRNIIIMSDSIFTLSNVTYSTFNKKFIVIILCFIQVYIVEIEKKPEILLESCNLYMRSDISSVCLLTLSLPSD